MDLTGKTLGRYRLLGPLGRGPDSIVYLAQPTDGGQELAVKVLDPALSVQRGFQERLEATVRIIAALAHPNIVPLYECGSGGGLAYVVMASATGGSLRDRIAHGPLPPGAAWDVLSPVADALHSAHAAGALHLDVKPSNILFGADGQVMLSDFGLARSHLGFAIGTPAYMSPEQAMGDALDERADVYSLAVVLFEMLTGARPYADLPVPDLLVAVASGPVPSLGDAPGDFPADLDAVLRRALAKARDLRPRSPVELLYGLTRVLVRSGQAQRQQVEISPSAFKGESAPVPDAPTAGSGPGPGEFERVRDRMLSLVRNALTAAIAVDESSFVVGWNPRAEETFGWSADEIVGRALSSTLIPSQYREAHERGFRRFLETGEGPVLGQVVEITAMNRAGRELPIKLSISPALSSGQRALFVAYAEDMTGELRERRLAAARAGIADVLANRELDEVGICSRALEALGASLEWQAGILWEVEGEAVRCRHFWTSGSAECGDLEEAVHRAKLGRDRGLAGRVCRSGEAAWVTDVLHEAGLPLALAAVRAGLRCAVGAPVRRGESVGWVLEFLGREALPPDQRLLDRLDDFGRRIGRAADAARSPAAGPSREDAG